MPMRNTMPSKGEDVQPYKYNGKELDRMHGLNTYDYGARQYNPVTGRWDRMDPLSEDHYPITLGSDYNSSRIIYTENFFADDKNAFNKHGYGKNVYSWLRFSSHEVVHLKHVKQAENVVLYSLNFLSDYMDNGHDGSERKHEADKGRDAFNAFNTYINKAYGRKCIRKTAKFRQNRLTENRNTIKMVWKLSE